MSKHCTNAGCSYTHAHTVEWCGYPEPKVNPKPMADADALRAYLGGYVSSMENSIPAMNDPGWTKYLHAVQSFNVAIQTWLDRNAK